MAQDEYARYERAIWHARKIKDLLSTPKPIGVYARRWRLRYWLDNEMLVASITEMQGPRPWNVYLIRGYPHEMHLRKFEVVDSDAADEIVAFLRLDLLDTAITAWEVIESS